MEAPPSSHWRHLGRVPQGSAHMSTPTATQTELGAFDGMHMQHETSTMTYSCQIQKGAFSPHPASGQELLGTKEVDKTPAMTTFLLSWRRKFCCLLWSLAIVGKGWLRLEKLKPQDRRAGRGPSPHPVLALQITDEQIEAQRG